MQWPLGYSREAENQCQQVTALGPVLVYNSNCPSNFPERPSQSSTWSKYYDHHNRQPNIVDELAPWLIEKLNKR